MPTPSGARRTGSVTSASEYKFPYPLFVTWYQLVVALGLLVISGELGKR